MAKIQKIIAREILDSRGIPTIEGKLTLDNGENVYATATSGESRGRHEGFEIRDRDEKRYEGMGVLKPVSFINDLIAPKLIGVDVSKHFDVDFWLKQADATDDFSNLGVNTAFLVSQLVLKAAAKSQNIPIYQYINKVFNESFKKTIPLAKTPAGIFCMINGGKHGSKSLEFQEFQVIPSTANKFSKSLEISVEVYSALKKILDYRNAGTSVSEEGGFSPNLLTNIDAIEVIKETLTQKKLIPGLDVFLGIDAAASDYFHDGKYHIKDKPNPMEPNDYIEYLENIAKDYNILVLEDAVDEEDHDSWAKINKKLGNTSYIVADDFVAGNKVRLEHSIKDNSINGVLFKFNQVGTFAQMFETINFAQNSNLKIVISHRLGESNDTLLADLAVGVQADFVKFGAPVRGERVAKYNRLLEIESEIKK